MNDIQKKLSKAHKMISIISVSGDAVDVMSAARLRIKEAYEMAGDKSALWDAHKLADKEKQEEQNGG